jgi:hypothetical protein
MKPSLEEGRIPQFIRGTAMILFAVVLLCGIGVAGERHQVVFAGKWMGTLRIESQDSYRGNDAKGEHRVSFAKWIIEVSNDEKTVSFRPVDWHGPAGHAAIVHKNERTLGWTESVKASMSAPMTIYRSNGEKAGTSIGLRPDYDATWTMRATSDRTAILLCDSNREDAYARITETSIIGTLAKE